VDDLSAIREFWPDVGVNDAARERARTALLEYVARPRRIRRRPWTLALVAVALAAVIVGTAFAFGPLRDLFRGEPAPKNVKQTIRGFGPAPQGVKYGMEGDPGLLADETRGILRSRTSGGGTALLWAAPRRDGGSCTFLEVRGLHATRGVGWFGTHFTGSPIDPGPCTGPRDFRPPVIWGHDFVAGRSHSILLLLGHAEGRISSIELRIGKRTLRPRLAYGYFMAEVSGGHAGQLGARELLTASDRAGHRVASYRIRSTEDSSHFMPPSFYAGAKVVIRLPESQGVQVLMAVRKRGGDVCVSILALRDRGGLGQPSCGSPDQHYPVARCAGRRCYANGYAGEGATVELRFRDGTNATAPLHDGYFLAALPSGNQKEIVEYITSDQHGNVVAHKRSPYRPTG
jgi:hypothetical protein